MKSVEIDGHNLTIEKVWAVAQGEAQVRLHPQAEEQVERARQVVERLMEKGEAIYGVTTGFGHFLDQTIGPEQAATLQRNLALSHAVGVGPPLSTEAVRATMLIRANSLAQGHSGIRLETLETLVEMINRGVTPIVPAQGSLGASGDLAPLAHMTLVLIGEGEAYYEGERLSGGEAMRIAGLLPRELGPKEGVALLNSTAVTSALAALNIHRAENLVQVADLAGALSLEALGGTLEAFDERIHLVRPHPGQGECAANLRRLLEGSELARGHDPHHLQDAYSLRCMPQVHGAVRDGLAYARRAVETEINSASDNPLIFWEEERVLSGGNFHAEPVALVMDHLTLAMAELGNISERRLARLLDENLNRGLLPPFLTKEGGLNTGFMMVQYTAAALASENKVLAHPASVDNVSVSAGTEDHVSMGTIAARQAQEVIGNVEAILAIELLAAAQAVDFRRGGKKGLKLGKGTAPAYEAIRERVPFMERDTIMYPHIEAVRELVKEGELIRRVTEALKEVGRWRRR